MTNAQFTLCVFEPDHIDSTCIVSYYCCFHYGPYNDCNETWWIVPGTLNLED